MKRFEHLTTMQTVKYCLGVWRLNHQRFLDFEFPYYQGLDSDQMPHGIDNFYWQKAYKFYCNAISLQ
jgi:hypothetical protein